MTYQARLLDRPRTYPRISCLRATKLRLGPILPVRALGHVAGHLKSGIFPLSFDSSSDGCGRLRRWRGDGLRRPDPDGSKAARLRRLLMRWRGLEATRLRSGSAGWRGTRCWRETYWSIGSCGSRSLCKTLPRFRKLLELFL